MVRRGLLDRRDHAVPAAHHIQMILELVHHSACNVIDYIFDVPGVII
jgi:hypothetical protein